MIHGSLFSGIGGFDLAAEWMGWTNAFHCEWEEFPRKVLQYHFPESKSYGDINETDFTIWNKKIDILTGGFPCQPYSAAGKRLGKEDERHLWPQMLRAIREIEPRWIIGENVYGLVSWNEGLVFEEVQVDLENEGYEVQPYILPAASVNAPHRRDRVWFVAYSNNSGTFERLSTERERSKAYQRWKEQSQSKHRQVGKYGHATNTNSIGHHRDTEENGHDTSDKYRRILQGERHDRHEVWGETQRRGAVATNTRDKGLQGGEVNGSITSIRQERNEQPTRCIPPTWDEFPTKSPVCGRDDGIPRELDSITFPKWRNESIKAYGNAIVPQVAYQLFKTIEKYMFCKL